VNPQVHHIEGQER